MAGKKKMSKTKAALYLVVIGILVAIVAGRYVGKMFGRSFWLTEKSITSAKASLVSKQVELQEELDHTAKENHARGEFKRRSYDYWLDKRDGSPETNLQKKIEQAAKLTDVKLTTVGSPRKSKIADNVISFQMSIACTGSMEAVPRFVAEICRVRPTLRWEHCSIRPDNVRHPENLMLNGTLKLIQIDDSETVDFLLKEPEKETDSDG